MFSLKAISWGIAYRERGSSDKKFRVVKNPTWGWAADPFLFTDNGKLYLFAELWDYRKGRAGIGYQVLSDQSPKWKVVIEEDYHLSYPNIMRLNGQIYICPESCNDRSVYFYRAVSFPDKWEKQKPIITGKDYSDTTFLKRGDVLYGFTCRWHENPHKLDIFKIEDGKVEYSPANPIVEGGALARPGGNFFEENGKTIRVNQDCSEYYGKALVFTELDFHWPDFDEKVIKRIEFSDIELDQKEKAIGIHTYNQCGNYEVIDFKIKKVNLINLFYRIVLKVKRGRK